MCSCIPCMRARSIVGNSATEFRMLSACFRILYQHKLHDGMQKYAEKPALALTARQNHTSMGSELLEHRAVEEIALIYAILAVSKIAHSAGTVHQNGIRPKPY